ncbi:Uncharacterised protein [Klebsiella pneumoniae]|nr:Uncharacterised protein [Klebsiella pneumoniae]SSI75725.1 Uncharacterised protein [Klebsiella pneumoniae]SWX70768.1 Uncharacterised protein [Klebsiella pneumoniae]SXO23344.1 Uncharacterised protein [Klebsiella pneumoniae]VGC17168.1 Uncharacterised protein [Klebsiella pneumoniae]
MIFSISFLTMKMKNMIKKIYLIDYRNSSRSLSEDLEELALYSSEENTFIVVDNNQKLSIIEKEIPDGFILNVIQTSNHSTFEIAILLNLIKDNSEYEYYVYELGAIPQLINRKMYACSHWKQAQDIYSNYTSIKHLEDFECQFSDVIIKGIINKVKINLQNILYHELSIFAGESLINTQQLMNMGKNDYLDNIKLSEFITLCDFYKKSLPNVIDGLKEHIRSREKPLTKLLNTFFDTSGNLSVLNKFPIAHFYISAYYLIASLYKEKKELYTSSFLCVFRTLDIFCEGVLIFEGKGTILNKKFLISTKTNTLVKPLGFRNKWDVVKKTPSFSKITATQITDIETFLLVRNNSFLTHGTVKINKQLLHSFLKVVTDIISAVESTLNLGTLNVTNCMKELNNIFNFSLNKILYDILLDERKILIKEIKK